MMMINGNTLLKVSCTSLNIDLVQLIATTSIWASPYTVFELKKGSKDNENALWVKNCRRLKNGEIRRKLDKNGVFIDDNTIANKSIKKATGEITEQSSFTACHIYKNSCYNKDYYTSIPNLVLIPHAISSLTDNNEQVIAALKFRSFELYNFFIESKPKKPVNFDNIKWAIPIEFSNKIQKSIKLRKSIY